MLQAQDLFIIERGGVKYNMTADQLAEFVGAVNDVTAVSFADLQSETFIGGESVKAGDRVFVTNATGDPTVDSGWALYRVTSTGPLVTEKIQEQESLDLVITTVTDLSFITAADSGTVVSSAGSNAVIPLATATDAGLASPAMVAASHAPLTTALTAQANPINVDANQVVSFSISQLSPLP